MAKEVGAQEARPKREVRRKREGGRGDRRRQQRLGRACGRVNRFSQSKIHRHHHKHLLECEEAVDGTDCRIGSTHRHHRAAKPPEPLRLTSSSATSFVRCSNSRLERMGVSLADLIDTLFKQDNSPSPQTIYRHRPDSISLRDLSVSSSKLPKNHLAASSGLSIGLAGRASVADQSLKDRSQ